MPTTLSVSGFFILASVLQGLFLGLGIRFSPALRSPANNFLAYFLLLVSGMTFLGWQEWDVFWIDYVWSHMWEFLIPVMLFRYYVLVLNHPHQHARWLHWLYVPFFVFFVIDLVLDGYLVFGFYQLPFVRESAAYELYDAFLDFLSLWYNIALIGYCLYLAKTDRAAPPGRRRWLINFAVAMLMILGVWLLSDYVQHRTNVEDPYSAIWISTSLFFWYVAYNGVYRQRLLTERVALAEHRQVARPVEVVVPAGADYEGPLRRLMEEEQLFRNPDLGRQVVAARLGISEGYLSQVMSAQVGASFVEFVTGYRVGEARRLLADPEFDRYSLEAIGLEAGFRSRSAFYTAFKSATGQTPGVFRKAVKAS